MRPAFSGVGNAEESFAVLAGISQLRFSSLKADGEKGLQRKLLKGGMVPYISSFSRWFNFKRKLIKEIQVFNFIKFAFNSNFFRLVIVVRKSNI